MATLIEARPAGPGGPSTVRAVLDVARAEQRTSLTAPEGRLVCDAYGLAMPRQRLAVGALTDPAFGPVVTVGPAGVSGAACFRLAPTSVDEASTMVDETRAAAQRHGLRGGWSARDALAELIAGVSRLVTDFPEITEADLDPTVVGARFSVSFEPPEARPARYSRGEILATMNRLLRPRAIAVIGAFEQPDTIGDTVMRNLVDGGFTGEIHPVDFRGATIHGRQAYPDVAALPDGVDVAVLAIGGDLAVDTLAAVGDNGIPAAIVFSTGFAETRDADLHRRLVETAREHGVRFVGPNVHGVWSTPGKLSAASTTPYDVKGPVALVSESGGIGKGILGFCRSTKLGVSAIVGLGNKADIDEDDLLTFFEDDKSTRCVALQIEELNDGRAFVEVAQRVSRKKPIVVLKAGDDKLSDDLLRQAGVIRAGGLCELLRFARCLPLLPAPKGENVLIITGGGGSGVLLADACHRNGLQLMELPDDLHSDFTVFIQPFGVAGNPVDITDGEPPQTYRNTIELGLEDDRIHALVLGYWQTTATPPLTFAKHVAQAVAECRERGIEKPVVVSLAGETGVEHASEYLFDRGIPAFPYTTETPVQVLAAKYRWARIAGAAGTS